LLLIYLTETLRSENIGCAAPATKRQQNTNSPKMLKNKNEKISVNKSTSSQLTSTNNQQSATSSKTTIKSTREAFETTSTTRQIV